jgi:hypothetical protein
MVQASRCFRCRGAQIENDIAFYQKLHSGKTIGIKIITFAVAAVNILDG